MKVQMRIKIQPISLWIGRLILRQPTLSLALLLNASRQPILIDMRITGVPIQIRTKEGLEVDLRLQVCFLLQLHVTVVEALLEWILSNQTISLMRWTNLRSSKTNMNLVWTILHHLSEIFSTATKQVKMVEINRLLRKTKATKYSRDLNLIWSTILLNCTQTFQSFCLVNSFQTFRWS